MRISNEPIIKEILGSKVKRKILSFLFSKQGAVSERELARVIGVSHTAVNKAMKQLLELNLVSAKNVGSALIWELNEKSLAYPYAKMLIDVSNKSSLEYTKDMLKMLMNMFLVGWNLMDKSLRMPKLINSYIFGSVAEGTSSPESDIDLLVILEFKPNEKRLKDLLRLFVETVGKHMLEKTGNQVSFHIYDQKAIEKNEPAWLKSSIEKGIRVL